MNRDQDPSDAADPFVNDAYAAANAATAAGDDTPDPRVRATVLAAAARAVDARPHAVDRPSARRRWPLSAAALVVVSVLTGLVASQALRDDPDRVLTTTRIAVKTPSPPPPRLDAERPTDAIEASNTTAPFAESSRPTAGSKAVPTPAAREARRSPIANATVAKPSSPAPTVPAPESVIAQAAKADAGPTGAPRTAPASPMPAPPPAAASSLPTTREKTIAPSLATGDRLAAAPSDKQADEASPVRADLQEDAAPRPAPHGRVGIEPVSPEAWVDRIVAMRALGDAAAADRELDALRRRYPDFTIPSRAFANRP